MQGVLSLCVFGVLGVLCLVLRAGVGGRKGGIAAIAKSEIVKQPSPNLKA